MKRIISHTDHCDIRTADREDIVDFIEALEDLYFKSYKDCLYFFGPDSRFTKEARTEWHAVSMVAHKLLH